MKYPSCFSATTPDRQKCGQSAMSTRYSALLFITLLLVITTFLPWRYAQSFQEVHPTVAYPANIHGAKTSSCDLNVHVLYPRTIPFDATATFHAIVLATHCPDPVTYEWQVYQVDTLIRTVTGSQLTQQWFCSDGGFACIYKVKLLVRSGQTTRQIAIEVSAILALGDSHFYVYAEQPSSLQIGSLTLRGDTITPLTEGGCHVAGNVRINDTLWFSHDVQLTRDPQTGGTLLTTDGSLFVKLRYGQATLLSGPGLRFEMDGRAGTLNPHPTMMNIQWVERLAGMPLWVSGTPITIGEAITIEPTLYIGAGPMTLASFKASLRYTPGGDKQLLGFEVIEGQLLPGSGLQFFGMSGNYNPETDVFTGNIKMRFPFLWVVGENAPALDATVHIKPTCSPQGAGLNGFDITVGLPNSIPLGTTGLSIAGFTLKVDGICEPSRFTILIGGNLGIVGIPGDIVTLSKMRLGYQAPYSLVIEGGTAQLLRYPVGALSGRIQATPGHAGIRLNGWVNFADLLQADTRVMVNVSRQLLVGHAAGALQLPDFPCSWHSAGCRTLKAAITSVITLPQVLQAQSFDLYLKSSGDAWQGQIRGMTHLGGLEVAVVLAYEDGDLTLLVGPNYADVIGIGLAIPKHTARAATEQSITLTKPQSNALFGVAARSPHTPLPVIYLKTPTGQTLTPTETGASVRYVADPALKVALFRLDEAAVGDWTLGVTNLTAADVQFQWLTPTPPPQVRFEQVTVQADQVNIQLRVQPVGVSIQLFAMDESGGTAQPIGEPVRATTDTLTVTWQTAAIQKGSYRLWARADDGKNAPIQTHYGSAVVIGAPSLSPPVGLEGVWRSDGYALRWQASSSPSVMGYRVVYTDQVDAPDYRYSALALGREAVIDRPEGSYRFAVIAVDAQGHESAPSVPWYSRPTSSEVRLLDNQVPISDTVTSGGWQFFKVAVPRNAQQLTVTLHANAGVELYVKQGQVPTQGDYHYRMTGADRTKQITVLPTSSPRPLSAGDWFIGVYSGAQQAFTIEGTVAHTPCLLTCAATVPAWAAVGDTVSFQGQAVSHCPEPVQYRWTFGDEDTASQAVVSHPYRHPGPYLWTFTALAGPVGCVQSGTLVIGGTQPTVPAAPIMGTATAGDGTATVTFQPPPQDGGSPIVRYTVTASPTGQSVTGLRSPLTVTGLTNNQSYTFTVTATNAVGTSAPSAPSNAVVPMAVVPTTGVLQVQIEPAAARQAGAAWRRVGTASWLMGGMAEELPVGRVTVEFQDLTGWIAPAQREVTLAAGQTTSLTVTYSPSLAPPSAPIALPATAISNHGFTAQWQAVSGATGYRLDVAQDTAFSRWVSSYRDVDVGLTTQQVIRDLTAATPYYYRVRAYNSAGISGYSDVQAVTTAADGITVLTSGQIVSGLSGAAGSQRHYAIDVPSGMTRLQVQLSEGDGDADLYVRYQQAPTPEHYDCRSWDYGSHEQCLIRQPAAGRYVILVHGYGAYAGVSLRADYSRDSGLPAPQRFVEQQYRDFLGREGDPAGIQYWTTALTTGRVSYADMVDHFFHSQEFQANGAPVVRLYFAYFDRIPDYVGLMYWMNGYRQGGLSLEAIAQAFAQSDEFRTTYGALNAEQFVDRVYVNVLGRYPDAAGRTYWVRQLAQGMTRGAMMVAFSESEEYRSLIHAEVQVTMMYIGMLRREPDVDGFYYWVSERWLGRSIVELIEGFLDSEEYQNRFRDAS